MGEWSKKVGEAGESIAAKFLRLVGWDAAQAGVELPCVRPEVHKVSGHARRTHGIDYLLGYRSPLVDGLGQNLIVSVKFSADQYPNNPARIFKDHFSDLAHTIECFKNSDVRRTLVQTVKGVAKTQDVGVLFWINNDRETEGDVISQLVRVIMPDTLNYEAIYIVDNRRARFIFDSVNYARRIANGCEVEFFYPDTGKNVNPLCHVKHGRMLPVEYINSSVLPLRIADKTLEKRILLLSTLERFSDAGLKRLLGLAQHLSQDWCSQVVIAFPDYDQLQHSNAVQIAKGSFSNSGFANAAEIHCYDEDFRIVRH